MLKLNSMAYAIAIALGSATTFAAETQADKQEKIIVTGSHIKRIDREGSSPLLIISREDIARSGASTLAELLQGNSLTNGGSLNNQQTGGFTPGAASFNLRGLRADRTLVLVDGHRLASYPFGQNGNEAFVDLNSIPLMEVDSVEILKDGASAIYGSDAISGVVNIVTKREFKGSHLNLKTQQSTGNYQANLVSLTTGSSGELGDLLVIAEFQDHQALLGEDIGIRGLTANESSLYSFPGTYLTQDQNANWIATPAANCQVTVNAADRTDAIIVNNAITGTFCVNDWGATRQIIPENTRASLTAKWSQYVGEHTFFAELALNQIETLSDVDFGMLESQFFVSTSSPFNPIAEDLVLFRGYNDRGLQEIDTDVKNTRLNMGFEGLISYFDYKATLNHSQSRVNEIYGDGWWLLNDFVTFQNDVATQLVNPFVAMNAEQQSTFNHTFKHTGKSDNTALAFNFSGEVSEFAAGGVLMASGVEIRKESLLDTSEQAIIDRQVLGLGLSLAEGERKVASAFAEFVLPATENLEFNLALRYDNYDDFGSSFNPKFSFSYKANDSFLIRSSYGSGFRAPNLFELNGEVYGSVAGYAFVSPANPDLGAETSESYNLGLVFDYENTLTTSIDFWQINVDDMITELGLNRILTTLDEQGNRVYQDLLIFDNQGNFDHFINPYVNLDRQESEGIDLSVNYLINDHFSFKLNASHLSKLTQFSGDSAATEMAGSYLFPKKRVTSSFVYKTGSTENVLSINHIGQHGYDNAQTQTDNYQLYHYQFKFSAENYSLSLVINNLTDELPPMDLQRLWPYYDQRIYSALGRTYTLSWQTSF